MNKTQQKLTKYGQAVNDLIDNTEKVQEGMSKYFTPYCKQREKKNIKWRTNSNC